MPGELLHFCPFRLRDLMPIVDRVVIVSTGRGPRSFLFVHATLLPNVTDYPLVAFVVLYLGRMYNVFMAGHLNDFMVLASLTLHAHRWDP